MSHITKHPECSNSPAVGEICLLCGLDLIDGKDALQVRQGRISGFVRRAAMEGRAVEAHLLRRQGAKIQAIADLLEVSKRTVYRYLAMPFLEGDTNLGGGGSVRGGEGSYLQNVSRPLEVKARPDAVEDIDNDGSWEEWPELAVALDALDCEIHSPPVTIPPV